MTNTYKEQSCYKKLKCNLHTNKNIHVIHHASKKTKPNQPNPKQNPTTEEDSSTGTKPEYVLLV